MSRHNGRLSVQQEAPQQQLDPALDALIGALRSQRERLADEVVNLTVQLSMAHQRLKAAEEARADAKMIGSEGGGP
jgi:hypothetical protein